jgi:hypothetical protein
MFQEFLNFITFFYLRVYISIAHMRETLMAAVHIPRQHIIDPPPALVDITQLAPI